jgi:uncharacterized protein YaiE (UPF0345 family)
MFHSYSFIVLLFSLVLTGCGGGGGSDSPSFLSGSPSAITVLPAEAEFVTGVTQQYTAIATFSDGSQNDITDGATCSVADESIATVDLQTGLLTTIIAGTTAVTAEFRDVAASENLTVISSDLIQLVILPADASAPVGTTGNYTAIAYFEDGSTEDVTMQSVWSSSDTVVVSIVTDGTNAGFAEAKKPGTANISAKFMGVTKTVPAIVTAATLEKIIVGPFKTTVGLGTSVAYTAIGIYSDRSILLFDDEVSWSSADESVATVNEEGIAFTTGVGATNITAAFSGISGGAAITVTASDFVGLQIIPGSVNAPIGTNGQLQLVAFYLDGNTAVVTADAVWSSSDISKATVQPDGTNAGLLTLLAKGDVIITASYDGQTASIPVTVTAAVLQEIILEPLNPSIGIGASVNFTATGIYNDGSSQDISDEVSWQSSAIDVATIDLDGKAQAIAVGVSIVQASFGSVLGSTELTVTGAFLESVEIVPGAIDVPAGTSGQLQAFAYYDDGSVVDVTADSAWISSADSIIAVLPSGPNAGFSVARVAGSATISANFQSVAGSVVATVSNAVLEQLVLTPATASIAAGETQDYIAIGIYSDDSGQFLNDDVSWQSSAPLIATVDAKGRTTGIVDGSATLTVSLDGFSANAQLIVSPATVTELIAIPASLSSPVGSVGQLQAVAVYSDATVSDVTALATWNSTDDAVITVVASGGNAGQASALTEGFATVEVNYGGQLAIIDSTVIATVLTTILVEPVDTSIALGTEQAFTATGIYLDGTSQPLNEEVSWQSSNTAVASIDPSGMAKGLAAGGTTITASFAGLSGATQLVVNAPVITSIQIEPSTVETPVGTAGPFTAIAYFSDLTTTDITRQAIWSSTDSAVVSVIATGVDAGFAQALIPGSASIKASFQVAEGIAPVVVTAATLTSIQV